MVGRCLLPYDPAPPASEKVRLACLCSRENRARERARIRGTPQKGLRFRSATIHARRRSDFSSCSFMIAPVETGLKVHAGNDTTLADRQETTLRRGLTSSTEGPHREQYAYPPDGASAGC